VFKGLDANAVERFVLDDPYMKAGLITAWRAQPWKLV
jgi:uncharacterized protein YciI